MSKPLPAMLDRFHEAILTRDAALATPDIKINPNLPPQHQLAIYIDGYRIRLLQAIAADYPALKELLGAEEFDRLAGQFIEEHPPTHFSLDHYPFAFAGFVRAQHGDDFAADLALLEQTIAEVFMMEESAPLDASVLSGLTPETFGGIVLQPRAASRLLALDYPAETYLAEQRAGNRHAALNAQASHVFVVRHKNEAKRHPLTHAEYRVLSHLFDGKAVGEAVDEVLNSDVHGDEIARELQSWFTRWVAGGFFRAPCSELGCKGTIDVPAKFLTSIA